VFLTYLSKRSCVYVYLHKGVFLGKRWFFFCLGLLFLISKLNRNNL